MSEIKVSGFKKRAALVIKRAVKNLAHKHGFDLRRIPRTSPDRIYESIFPGATYSPWNKDTLFLKTYSQIQHYTLVDKYRCYELWSLVRQTAKLPVGCLLEVGLWRGGSGALIARQAKNCRIEAPVYLCDTFQGVVKAGEQDSLYQGGEHRDTTRQIVADLLYKQLKLDNAHILEGIFPNQTGAQVEHLRFRFCHIDVDVYQSSKDIVDWLWGRMIRGGIIVYDDYGFYGCDGITKYVEEQIPLSDRIVLYNLNGHAVVIKLE